MAIEKIKLRNVADLSIEKVHCYRYFDEGNLQVIGVKNLKVIIGPKVQRN